VLLGQKTEATEPVSEPEFPTDENGLTVIRNAGKGILDKCALFSIMD
jgi:hypothetical protein